MGANQSRVRIPLNLGLPFWPVAALGSNLLSHLLFLTRGQIQLNIFKADVRIYLANGVGTGQVTSP